MADRNIQKILIKPPLSGLNIHDNPLDLSFMFATELVNFLPPTTKLEVRPGVENIMILDGIPLGMYSYSVGARKIYQSSGLLITMPSLSTPAYSSILVKCSMSDGMTNFYSINPVAKTKTYLDRFKCNEYNNNYCMLSNSMFFTDGSNSSAPYIYSGTRGISRMAWKTPGNTGDQDPMIGGKDLTDLANVTAYNGYIFANSVGTVNVYYMLANTADPEAPNQKAWLNKVFKPTSTGYFTLTGFNKLGGSIIKMFTLGANQKDTIASYLCVLTDQGELLLYQGTNPADLEQWKLQGVFRIPVPLNPRAYCQVEGDVIIATQVGIVSVQRIVFGNKTQITEALEWRLSELFSRYEFRMNAYKNHFFLKYHNKSRQLIFNVPEFVPTRLYDIARGYVFNKDRSLVFDANVFFDDMLIQEFYGFINDYLVKRQIDYEVRFIFNADERLGIKLKFSFHDLEIEDIVVLGQTKTIQKIKLTITYSVTVLGDNGEPVTTHLIGTYSVDEKGKEELFEPGWDYQVNNIYDLDPELNITPIRCDMKWNLPAREETIDGVRGEYFVFELTNDDDVSYEVTDIRPIATTLGVTWGNHDLYDFVLDPNPTPTSFNEITQYDTRAYTKTSHPHKDPALLFPGNIPYGGQDSMPSFESYVYTLFRNIYPYVNINPNDYPLPILALIGSAVMDSPVWKSSSSDHPVDNNVALYYVIGNRISFKDFEANDSNVTIVHQLDIWTSLDYLEDVRENADRQTRWNIYAKLDTTVTDTQGNAHNLFGADFKGKTFIKYRAVGHGSGESRTYTAEPIKQRSFMEWSTSIRNPGDDITAGGNIGQLYMSGGETFFYKNVEKESTDGIIHSGSSSYHFNPSAFTNLPPVFLTTPAEQTMRAKIDTYLRNFPSAEPNSNVTKRDKAFTETNPKPRNFYYNKILGALDNCIYISGTREGNLFTEATNFDLSTVPFISFTKTMGQYESSQYVFDTHYGTWSQWKGINMVDAVEHENDFYFVRTEPRSLTTLDVSTRSMLCRFNPDFNGDFEDAEGNSTPIVATYQAGHTDIAIGHSKKQFKRVKIHGTSPVFWGTVPNVIPFIFKYETDFVPREDIIYPYSDYEFKDPYAHPVMAAFKEKYGIDKKFKDLTYMEKKKYMELYAIIAEQVKSIELPLTAGPCDRISMGCELQVVEHNLIIYGYELFYEVVNP